MERESKQETEAEKVEKEAPEEIKMQAQNTGGPEKESAKTFKSYEELAIDYQKDQIINEIDVE